MNVKTVEHGRFYAGPNGQRRFAGSASGVYLADTIRNRLPPHLGSEGGFVEAFISQLEGTVAQAEADGTQFERHLLTAEQLSDVPELQIRFKQYFADWHKLFPFVDGKALRVTFAQALNNAKEQRMGGLGRIFGGIGNGDALVQTAVLRAVFTIGGAGRAAPALTPELPVYQNAETATQLAHVLVSACDSYSIDHVKAIQGIFAVALSLYCARWFRPASHLMGTLTKLVHSAGLHRCPDRYPTTFETNEERDIRKRLFYSIYVLDRLVSKQLGLPLLLRDVDIDVCLPGADEIHGPKQTSIERPETEGPLKRRRMASIPLPTESPTPIHPSNPNQTSEGAIDTPGTTFTERVSSNSFRLLPAFSLARLAGIMGRIMETFNGSRRWRVADPEHAARIRTDLDEWWLDFELDMQDNNHLGNDPDPRAKYATLFRCLYNQQIMHMHRHSLSLPITSDAHRYSLQAEILSARTICATLGADVALSTQAGGEILWPGYPDMLFDASSILVYATKVPSKLTEKRASASLQQANLAMGKLEAQWATIRPVAVVIRDLARHLDPQVEQTNHTTPTNIPLDWLLGSAFNLEANPSGPDLLPGIMAGGYNDMGLTDSMLSPFGTGNALYTTLAPQYQSLPVYGSYNGQTRM